MLNLLGVSVAFGDAPPLFAPVTADLNRASCVLVRGPHGSGKSTLLRICAGLAAPTEGRVAFDGASGGRPDKRRMGIVLPEHPLLPSRTLLENLILSQRLAGHPRHAALEHAYRMLRRLTLLSVADRFPGELSRSQAQLGRIARAVLRRPRLLIVDEPGQGLRPDAAAVARQMLSDAVVQGALLLVAATGQDPAIPEPDQVIALDRMPSSRGAPGTAAC